MIPVAILGSSLVIKMLCAHLGRARGKIGDAPKTPEILWCSGPGQYVCRPRDGMRKQEAPKGTEKDPHHHDHKKPEQGMTHSISVTTPPHFETLGSHTRVLTRCEPCCARRRGVTTSGQLRRFAELQCPLWEGHLDEASGLRLRCPTWVSVSFFFLFFFIPVVHRPPRAPNRLSDLPVFHVKAAILADAS
jgi:hypothetical protein